jgi:two-component system, NtrC family, sensor kinase
MKSFCRIQFLFVLTVIAFPLVSPGQTGNSINLLKERLAHFKQQPGYLQDTAYANTITDLAYLYAYEYPDSALDLLKGNAERCQAMNYGEGETDTYLYTGDAYQAKGMYKQAMEYYEKASLLAKKIHYEKSFPIILNRIGMIHLNQGNYPEALSKFYESLKSAETAGNKDLAGATLNNIAIVQYYQGKFDEAEIVYRQRLKIAEELNDTASMSVAYNGLGEVNLRQKNITKALQHLALACNLAAGINDKDLLLTAELSMAEAYYECDSLEKAAELSEKALQLSKQTAQTASVCNALISLAKTRYKQHLLKEALANGLEGLHLAEQMGQVQLMRDANEIVSMIYEASGEEKPALQYYKVYKLYADSMNSMASKRAVEIEKAGYEFSKKETEFERRTLQQQWIIASAFAGLLLLAVILWVIIRSRKRLNSTNKALQEKNKIIETQKSEAEETLIKLKATQSQLIQSEKMASLGELTAGIAHEIQNPLNFVNNFSDVNKELADELQEEADKGNIDEVKVIAKDIKDNEEKINHHGKRAEAIVKGMLQHSRSSSGVKEPTSINALADEYLRLAYHGLRAKDKAFNAAMQTDFDESIEKINIVPQDMGRVLLNLYNNAFYTVSEKKKGPHPLKGGEEYEPTVTVSTKKMGDKVAISVKDNGNGIPQKVVDKIFQPFFTTKPTGQGTGLGLSLAYDIVTKEHEGEIKVQSKEGEGTEFIILLPAI